MHGFKLQSLLWLHFDYCNYEKLWKDVANVATIVIVIWLWKIP